MTAIMHSTFLHIREESFLAASVRTVDDVPQHLANLVATTQLV